MKIHLKIIVFNTILWLMTVSNIAIAQVCTPGNPSTSLDTCPDSIRLAPIPVIAMPAVNNDSLILRDSIEGMGGIYRFGELFNVNINMITQGRWDVLPDGSKLCRLKIVSAGAWSIYFHYDDFWLPPQATFYIYSKNRAMTIGAFTELNNRSNSKFATQLVNGDTIVLEYYEPANVNGPARINISKVIHDYRNMLGIPDGPHGNSLPCHINVACPEGNLWRNEIRSVGLITIGGGRCSGVLLNNVRQDEIPFFLTAFHCIDTDNDGTISTAEETTAENMIVYFNHEAGRCQDNTWHNLHTISGATYLSGSPNSDFALFQLNTTPPAIYGVHYAGWSNENTPAIFSAGFHHPGGDIKKLAIDDDAAVNFPSSVIWQGGLITPPNSHWDVTYEDGRTEGGSSGSPLFDENHRVIGQLHGGFVITTCTTVPEKLYGKFSFSWVGDGTSDTRLSDHLDPDGTGVTFLDGLDPTCNNIDLTISEVINSGVIVTREASGTLTATNYTINSGGEATFISSKRIVVTPNSRANIGSKFHAFISPCSPSPPPTVELFVPDNPVAFACFLYVMAANVLHGKKPYQLTWTINAQQTGLHQFTLGHDDIASFTPVPNDHFTYSVTVTDADGITATSLTSPLINVSQSGFSCRLAKVSSKDSKPNNFSNHMFVYPNPNKGIFNLSLKFEQEKKTKIVVYNIFGKVIYAVSEAPILQKEYQINLSSHPNGIYIVRLITNDEVINKKIILSK